MGDYEPSSPPWLGRFLAHCWFSALAVLILGAAGYACYLEGMLPAVLALLAFCGISIWACKQL